MTGGTIYSILGILTILIGAFMGQEVFIIVGNIFTVGGAIYTKLESISDKLDYK